MSRNVPRDVTRDDEEWLDPGDVEIADDRLDKFVSEADDLFVTKPTWTLTLTDGERIVLVQTKEQLEAWCETYGITVEQFVRDFPIAASMPVPLRAAIGL